MRSRHFHVILGPSTLMGKMTRPDSRAQMIDTVRDVLVPRVGVEPTRPYGQRILSPFDQHSRHSTTRYQVVFTDVSAVKASYVSLGIST